MCEYNSDREIILLLEDLQTVIKRDMSFQMRGSIQYII